MTIHYEPHPVSPERKAELRAKGLKIIDARFAPEGSEVAQADDLTELRELYTEIVGKKPFHGWGAETLKAKMAEAAD